MLGLIKQDMASRTHDDVTLTHVVITLALLMLLKGQYMKIII